MLLLKLFKIKNLLNRPEQEPLIMLRIKRVKIQGDPKEKLHLSLRLRNKIKMVEKDHQEKFREFVIFVTVMNTSQDSTVSRKRGKWPLLKLRKSVKDRIYDSNVLFQWLMEIGMPINVMYKCDTRLLLLSKRSAC